MHPSITSQIATDRHQERLAQAARQRLARGTVGGRVALDGDHEHALRRIRRDRWVRRLRLLPGVPRRLTSRTA